MDKFLSIIIPSYMETEQQIFPLLSSITGQVGIDFNDMEVLIVRDGTDKLNEAFLSLFPFDTKQIVTEVNGGPGVARQTGIDAAKGKYLMFCDADDVIHNVGVIGAFRQLADANDPDMITSKWLEETYDETNKQYRYISHENENTWMHGKLFQRQFIVQNNIRHRPDLRVHEDSYFLAICAARATKIATGDFVSYVWKWDKNSITRRNNAAYYFDSVPAFIDSCCSAFHEIEKFNPDQMPYKVVQFVIYRYFVSHRPEWLRPENIMYLKKANEAFVKHVRPLWSYWENSTPEFILNIYNQERDKHFKGYMEIETLTQWLRRLGLSTN